MDSVIQPLNNRGLIKINCLVRKYYVDLITWRRRRRRGVFALCEMRKKLHVIPALINSVKVDFHCRVIFTCVRTSTGFTCVNKIETTYEKQRVTVKVTSDLPYIVSNLFTHAVKPVKVYVRTRVKTTRQWPHNHRVVAGLQ